MFRRIQYAEWQDILPILAFLISFSLFLIIVIRAIRMKKEEAKRLANQPLEEESLHTDKEKPITHDDEQR